MRVFNSSMATAALLLFRWSNVCRFLVVSFCVPWPCLHSTPVQRRRPLVIVVSSFIENQTKQPMLPIYFRGLNSRDQLPFPALPAFLSPNYISGNLWAECLSASQQVIKSDHLSISFTNTYYYLSHSRRRNIQPRRKRSASCSQSETMMKPFPSQPPPPPPITIDSLL